MSEARERTKEGLLAKLNEERAERVRAMAAAKGDDFSTAAILVAALDERIAGVEANELRCAVCGSKALAAWYSVSERQGIDVELAEDGTVSFDYDGDTSTGECGPDESYVCLDCEAEAATIEYLVGLTDEEPPPAIEEKTLSAEEAAAILFGPAFTEDDFDPETEQFASGADVCDALAAHFGFEDTDYRALAALRRAREVPQT